MAELVRTLEEEVQEYRRILIEEVRNHRWSSRIGLVRGSAFLAAGILMVAADFVPFLGWLLVLSGLLQILNGIYDLRKEDRLRQRLRQTDQKFNSARP